MPAQRLNVIQVAAWVCVVVPIHPLDGLSGARRAHRPGAGLSSPRFCRPLACPVFDVMELYSGQPKTSWAASIRKEGLGIRRFASLYASRRKRVCDERIVAVFLNTCVSGAPEVGEEGSPALLGVALRKVSYLILQLLNFTFGVFSKLKFTRSSHKGVVIQNRA